MVPKDEVYLKVNNRIFPLCDNWKYKVAVSSAQYDYVEYGPNAFPFFAVQRNDSSTGRFGDERGNLVSGRKQCRPRQRIH